MPTLADLEAAAPKCPRMVYRQRTELCAQPCRYSLIRDTWICPEHGDVATGSYLGHRIAAQESDDVLPHLRTAKR
jgi:hypothetical protein